MFSRERTTVLVALGVYAVVAIVYMITLAPTVPFWDAGEFIACSYILGIPHPPGTPLYILLGRVWSLIPLGTVAWRINAMSALPSALTIVFTYLSTLKLIRLAQSRGGEEGHEPSRTDDLFAHLGAVVAQRRQERRRCDWRRGHGSSEASCSHSRASRELSGR